MEALRYDNLIESIKSLSIEEKQEVKFLIDRYLIEEQREKIYKNFKNSLMEYDAASLEFSSDINILKKMIEE